MDATTRNLLKANDVGILTIELPITDELLGPLVDNIGEAAVVRIAGDAAIAALLGSPDVRTVRVADLVSQAEAAERIGIPKGTLIGHRKDETFPNPVWVSSGQGHPIFDFAEVRAWYYSDDRPASIRNRMTRIDLARTDRSSSGEPPPPLHHPG